MIEDVKAAWQEYNKNPTSELKDKLAEHYAGLVYKISSTFSHKKPYVLDFEDILQEGRLGLLDAIEKFDPDRGFQFSTYAQQRIRGAIIDGINVMDWTPRKTKKEIRTILTAIEAYGEENITDIATATGFSETEVKQIMGQMSKTYIVPMDYEGISQHAPSNDVEGDELVQTINHIIETTLNLTEQDVIKLNYMWGYPGSEIIKIMNISQKEFKDSKKSALEKLKYGLRTSGLSLDHFIEEEDRVKEELKDALARLAQSQKPKN